MNKHILSIAFALSIFAKPVHASQVQLEGLPIALGDTVERVQHALNTKLKPEPINSPVTEGATAIQLRTRGIWVFFDKSGRAYTIRLDAPFRGSVNGVRIGSTHTFVIERLGQPAKTLLDYNISGPIDPIIYYLNDSEGTRMDFDRNGMLETILISK